MDLNFSRSADFILLQVLGLFIDPDGTVWSDGVSQQQYADWCAKHNSPAQDVRSVSWTPTKKEIVKDLYWIPNGRNLPPGFDYLFFDAAWNLGVTDAIVILQRTVGAPATGVIDTATQAALGQLRVPISAFWVSTFCEEYENRFNEIVAAHPPSEARLRHFWPNRIARDNVNAMQIVLEHP